ncbi:MAG: envelope biogenesis factor ElyC [Pseudomonadota bacterium]
MFLIKKIISPLFYPLTLCLILMICGLFLLWLTKRQKSGKILVSMGVVFMVALSYGMISDFLLKSLERTFPPLLMETLPEPVPFKQKVKWIVVLGGGHTSDPGLPVTSQISFESLARMTEAVRLYRRLPGTKFILSGGAVFDPVSNARIYFKTARIMGVPAQDLVLSEQARDTEEEARFIEKMVGKDPLILVTSAFHMPRAMALFKEQGMDPIPAPVAHFVKERSYRAPGEFFPSTWDLHKAQMAVHEYLGIAWSKLRGRI